MPFCAGEKCKYEKVFQKLSDRLINVKIKKFAVFKVWNLKSSTNFIKISECNSKSYNNHSP